MAEVTRKGRKRTAREIDLVDDTIIPSIASKNEGEIAVSVEPPPKVARKSKTKAVLAKTPVEGDCTICFENYKNDYAVLKCNHIYCFKCIKEWSETENSCPLCKSRFTSLDRYNIGEGQKAKKQSVKVGKKDQWQSYLRQMQNNGPTAQGGHQFTFFPVTNSTIGRQLLLNLIHSLHPNASFDDDDDDEEEEDDEDWVPRGNFNESEDESTSGTQYDDQDDEEQIWIDLNRSGRVQARDEASAQPLINLVDDVDDDFDRLYDEINRLDGTSNNNIGRNNNARRLEGIVSSSIRQRMRPVVDLTLDEDDDLIRTFTTSSNSSNNSSSVPNSFADTGVLLQDA